MAKYDALGLYLKASCLTEIRLSFPEIERILGFALPRSAYTYPMWWANGGHSQANAWMAAGFTVQKADLKNATVLFSKTGRPSVSAPRPQKAEPASHKVPPVRHSTAPVVRTEESNEITVCGYRFSYVQQLIPVCENGEAKEFHPEDAFHNPEGLHLLSHGRGPFCRFSIDAQDVPGVYLWVSDGEIIYIGETVKFQQRFNMGYGHISPRNCYAGGQSTNCKMNKVVLRYFKLGRRISLYFHQTHKNKQVELDLLRQINTRYNVKDN